MTDSPPGSGDGATSEPPGQYDLALAHAPFPDVSVVRGASSTATVCSGDALGLYAAWPSPVVIVSDGPYGVRGYDGDPPTVEGLPEMYAPHAAAWAARSTPLTTLWFWNTELGWATVHPTLVRHGWTFRNCHVWDKGIAHASGNTNSKTLRKLPVVTEVCVQYVREATFVVNGRDLGLQAWLRYEWSRTGLPFSLTNTACGVKNAATRKYFTPDHLWYFPPVEAFEQFVAYANRHGRPTERPYFSADGERPLTGAEWERMRARFTCPLGVTNVWPHPAVRNGERMKVGGKVVHTNQKPLALMDLTVRASSDPGDVVWEPFGGLCSASVSALSLGRDAYAAEVQRPFYEASVLRLARHARLAARPDPPAARPGVDPRAPAVA